MNETTPENDLIINDSILRQTAINLRETRKAGLISDTRWDELRTLGKDLTTEVGNKSQLAVSSEMPLAPHILKAISDLRKAGATGLPKQPLTRKLVARLDDAMLHEQEEQAAKLHEQGSDA